MIDPEYVLSGDAGGGGVRAVLRSSSPREALSSLLPPSVPLGRCRLERVKFKPRRKLTACYRVDLGGPAGRVSRAVNVTWAPRDALGTDAGERGRATEAEAQARRLVEPFLALTTTIPARGMRVQISPFDPDFPQLVRLTDPVHVSVLLAGAGVAPGAYSSATDVSTVRFRPGERHVLRYRVTEDGRRRREVFAKLQDGSRGARSAALAAAVAEVLATERRLGATVAPALHVPEDAVVLYPRLAGAPLSRRLVKGTDTAGDHVARAGELLALLHRRGDALVASLPERAYGAELALTARASEHVGELLPPVAARIRSLLGRAEEALAGMPSEPAGFAHGDYKADHLLVRPSSLALLDLDSCRRAEPALDLGKFLADLSWWLHGRGESWVGSAQERFLAGYGLAPASPTLMRARAYEAVLLVRAAARRLRVDGADWGDRVALVVERAEHVLAASRP